MLFLRWLITLICATKLFSSVIPPPTWSPLLLHTPHSFRTNVHLFLRLTVVRCATHEKWLFLAEISEFSRALFHSVLVVWLSGSRGIFKKCKVVVVKFFSQSSGFLCSFFLIDIFPNKTLRCCAYPVRNVTFLLFLLSKQIWELSLAWISLNQTFRCF